MLTFDQYVIDNNVIMQFYSEIFIFYNKRICCRIFHIYCIYILL